MVGRAAPNRCANVANAPATLGLGWTEPGLTLVVMHRLWLHHGETSSYAVKMDAAKCETNSDSCQRGTKTRASQFNKWALRQEEHGEGPKARFRPYRPHA